MMIANITFSYTVEIGPHMEEYYYDPDFSFGFNVERNKIEEVVQRAYDGIREYLRSFVYRMNHKVKQLIDKKCLDYYSNFKKSFDGYWSFRKYL